MISTETASQLVAAAEAAAPPAPPAPVPVRVLRPFMLPGGPAKAGDVVDVAPGLAVELLSGGKAERAVRAAAPAVPSEDAGAARPARRAKEPTA